MARARAAGPHARPHASTERPASAGRPASTCRPTASSRRCSTNARQARRRVRPPRTSACCAGCRPPSSCRLRATAHRPGNRWCGATRSRRDARASRALRVARLTPVRAPREDSAVRVVPARGGLRRDDPRHALVDDQELVRGGFRMILDAQPDIEVVGESDDGKARPSTRPLRLHPDVVVMDVRMPGVDGVAPPAAPPRRRLAQPRADQLTPSISDEYVYDAIRAGASGFTLKDVSPRQLVEAVRTVATGDALLAPAITRRPLSDRRRPRTQSGVPRARPSTRARSTSCVSSHVDSPTPRSPTS